MNRGNIRTRHVRREKKKKPKCLINLLKKNKKQKNSHPCSLPNVIKLQNKVVNSMLTMCIHNYVDVYIYIYSAKVLQVENNKVKGLEQLRASELPNVTRYL